MDDRFRYKFGRTWKCARAFQGQVPFFSMDRRSEGKALKEEDGR